MEYENYYKIKELVDINGINKIAIDFNYKLWVRVIIPKTIKIAMDKPIIKSISKISVNAQNICYQLVTIETGKAILVNGVLCQSINYISNTPSELICNVKIYTNFSEYMKVQDDIDIEKDKFDIYPCIESAFINIINERTMVINNTVYLYAYKINPQIKPPIPEKPEKLPNKIILKSKSDEKILEIEFNKDEQELIVTSTGIKAYDSLIGVEYFKFILRDRFGNEVINASINTDENAKNFKGIVNNEEFEIYDSIELMQVQEGSIEVLNYPSLSETYILRNIKEKFTITNKGLIEYLYPNKIIINNDDKQELAKIEFDFRNNVLGVTSTQVQSTNKFGKNEEYLGFILLDENLNKNYQANIKGKENASDFKNVLNNRSFKNGDIIKLRYKNKENVMITNYKCKRVYNLEDRFDFFTITENNLIPYKLDILNTFVRVKNKDNTSIIDILFMRNNQILIADSSGVKNIDLDFLYIKLMDFSQKQEKYLDVLIKGRTGERIMQSLDNKKFEYSDVLELTYSDNNAIQIVNYPSLNNVYTPTLNSEKFIITPKGVIGFIAPTKVIVKNKNDEIIVIIAFNIKERVFKIEVTNNIADDSSKNNIYFSLELINNNMLTKRIAIIRGKENGQNFANKLNNKSFKEGSIIRLAFENSSKVEITNYPNVENKIYIPKEKEEFLKLDFDSVKSHFKILKNIVELISENKVVGTIAFNTEANKLIVNSTNVDTNCPSGFRPYLTLEVFRNNTKIVKELIECNITLKLFAQKMDGFCFKYNDEILFELIFPNKVRIKNFYSLGEDLETSNQRLIITPTGLKIKQ